MTTYVEKLVNFSGLILTTMGCWPLHYYRLSPPWNSLYRLNMWFMYISTTVFFIGATIETFTSTEDFVVKMDLLSVVMGNTIWMLKQTMFIFYRQRILRLIKNVEEVREIMVEDSNDSTIQNLELNCIKKSQKITLIMLASIGIAIIAYTTKFIVAKLKNRSSSIFPYPTKFPFNYKDDPMYTIILILELFASVTCICTYSAVGSLFATFGNFICTQFDILNISISKSNDVTDDNIYEYMKKCIKHHQAIYIFCTKLERLYRPIVFTQVIFSAMILSIFILEIKIINDFIKLLKNATSFIMIAGVLFVYCWYGEQITEKSETVSHSLYNTLWYERNVSTLKTISIMKLRSQKPVHITAMGFMNMTITSFTMVLKATYSYFTLLATINDKDKP